MAALVSQSVSPCNVPSPPFAGWNVGDTGGVGTVIVAQRHAGMGPTVTNDLQSWASLGGGEYNCEYSHRLPKAAVRTMRPPSAPQISR